MRYGVGQCCPGLPGLPRTAQVKYKLKPLQKCQLVQKNRDNKIGVWG